MQFIVILATGASDGEEVDRGRSRQAGALRRTLKAKKGKPIPAKKLRAAAKKGGVTGRRARLALTLRKIARKK